MKRLKIKEVLAGGEVGQQVLVKGWVRTKRGSKNVNFIALNDGSTINNLQVVADVEKFGESLLRDINTSAAIGVTGELVESMGSGQAVELVASEIEIYGKADPDKYPIQPKNTASNFYVKTPTCASVPRHSVLYSAFGMRWHLPFINISTTKDFITCIRLL